MNDLIIRLHALVPDAKCFTRDGQIIHWYDERPQPSEAELLAVDVAAIKAAEEAKNDEINTEVTSSPLNGLTFAQAEAYIDSNVSDPGTALVLKKMAKLLIAMGKKQGLIS